MIGFCNAYYGDLVPRKLTIASKLTLNFLVQLIKGSLTLMSPNETCILRFFIFGFGHDLPCIPGRVWQSRQVLKCIGQKVDNAVKVIASAWI